MKSHEPFSRRHSYRQVELPIMVREDAPDVVRQGIVMLADNLGLSPANARLEVCGILLKRPNPSNWTDYPNVFDEVQYLIEEAPWYKVYDIAEGLYSRLWHSSPDIASEFEVRLNELFCENGIGWEMQSGQILARGSEAYRQSTQDAVAELEKSGQTTASNEIHEALCDISRRPKADVTGAIQHAMAALECVAREVTGEPRKTLGQLIGKLNLPPPMDTAIEKLWGFSSEQGRHLREANAPQFDEAELIVTIASGVVVYLTRKNRH